MIKFNRGLILLLLVVGPRLILGQDVHVQRGLDLFRQQQFEAALQEFTEARKVQPRNAVIENLLGITDSKLNRITEADSHYKEAIHLDPKLPAPHKNLGFNYLTAGNYALAEHELNIALSLNQHDPFIHYYLASLYLATSRDQEAVKQLDPARSLLLNDPDNEFLMAKACLNSNHPVEGIALIEAMEARSQLSVDQTYEMAVLLDKVHLFTEATRRFQTVVAARPGLWEYKYDLAIAWLNANRADKAILVLEPLAIEQPENASVFSLLGSAYEAANQLPQALDAYQKAVSADPQNPDRYLDYTRLLMDLDRNDEATRIVEEGIQGAQDAYALDIRLGVLQMKKGKYDDARTSFNHAIELHPQILIGYIALAKTYMQQGRNAEAFDTLTGAREKLPQDATLEYYYGLVALRLGRNAEALLALKNAERLGPDVVGPHYQLGQLYFQTDQLKDAQREFERVVVLAPEYSNARYQLSRIYARLGDTEKSHQMALDTARLMQEQRQKAIALQRERLGDFRAPTSTSVTSQ